VQALAPLAIEHDLVITHGNGPQVGMLALESAHDPAIAHPYPFDVLGAQTQGMIGYWLLQALQNAVPGRRVACLISRTLVSESDPAFSQPSKFVGPGYGEQQARDLAARHGWQIRQDGGKWRRVVPSPEDLAAALLARQLRADALLLLTDVDAVQDGYGTPQARPVHRATPAQLRARSFPAGSMGPKVEAVCRFVEATGKMAAIGQLADAQALLERRAGTTVEP
jgi:carbamate kinase